MHGNPGVLHLLRQDSPCVGHRRICPRGKTNPFCCCNVQVCLSDRVHEGTYFRPKHAWYRPRGPFVERKRMKVIVTLCKLTTIMRIWSPAQVRYPEVVLHSARCPAVSTMVVQGCKVDKLHRLPCISAFLPNAVFEINHGPLVCRHYGIGHHNGTVIIPLAPVVI